MATSSVNDSPLDRKISDFVNDIGRIQIGRLMRELPEANLKKKVALAYLAIAAQNSIGIYPYDRFLKNGSASSSGVVSPAQNMTKDCIIWSSNHYLGINRDPRVIRYAHQVLDEYGTGCGTSAVSGGFSSVHKELETALARFFGKEEAILYPTGFTANLGAISSLANKGDLVIVDKESHASIIDGVIMSRADLRIFRHNSPENLEHILKKTKGKYKNTFVATESVFSMTGEEAPLKIYCDLKKIYDYYLYVDEAHAFGFYGKKGAGLSEQLNCSEQIDFLMSTLSKGTASIGGFIASEKTFCAYMRMNSNPYLFQACLTPVDAAVSLAALKIIEEDQTLREKLWRNTAKFRALVKAAGFDVGKSQSPIVPLYVPDESKLAVLCRELFNAGIFTNWVSFPVVPKRKGRLRFIVTAAHTSEQIAKTADILSRLGKNLGII